MKVYAVCELCDDDYYSDYLAIRKLFKDKENAKAYAQDLAEDYCIVTIKEYEIE